MKRMQDYLGAARCVLLDTADKGKALRTLAECVASALPETDGDTILAAIEERERSLSTRIAPGIALPHARLPQAHTTVAAALLSRRGIEYEPGEAGRVHLAVMIVGGDTGHIQALATVAATLQDRAVYKQARHSQSDHDLYQALAGESAPGPTASGSRLEGPSRAILEHSLTLARSCEAGAVLVHTRIPLEHDPEIVARFDRPIVRVFTPRHAPAPRERPASVQLLEFPFANVSAKSSVELSMLLALSRGYIRQGDRVIHVLSFSDSAQLDTVTVSEVDRAFRFFFATPGARTLDDLDQSVLIRVLQIATEIANEGREGKPIGTLFVLGDHVSVQARCQQMVMNPFRGYDERERNIMDPGLTETLKEYSHIDGAITVRSDGVILAAGVYLQHHQSLENFPQGLGARHAAAAGISAATHALAVVVSQSTRKISLFRSGRRIMTL